MSKVRDPLQTIQEALSAPIEAIEPTQFDDAAIALSMAAKYNNPNLQTELAKREVQNEPKSD